MLKLKLFSLLFRLVYALPLVLLFLGCEGKEESHLNKTVSTANLTGLNLFLANAYNNNRIVFALVSTGSIVVLGLIVTYIIGRIISPKHQLNKEE